MSNGRFFWHEIAARDPDAALRFYGEVVGWQAEPAPGNAEYFLLSMGHGGIAGVRRTQPGEPPRWAGYVDVDDVAAVVSAASGEGAEVLMPETEVPGTIRFALLADRDGLPFYVGKGLVDCDEDPRADAGPLGTVCWNELVASDWQASFSFFQTLFGWEKGEAMDMGPMGTYQIYGSAGTDQGGMMNAPAGMEPGWTFYVAVDDIDAAARRVRDAGGTVVNGPHEVPGGAFALKGLDPEGAVFGLVGGRKATA